MFRWVVELDDWLIDDVCQPFSDWTEEKFSLNNFGLARICALVSIPFCWPLGIFFPEVPTTFVVLVWGLIALARVYLLYRDEYEAREKPFTSAFNIERLFFRPMRIFSVVLGLLSIALYVVLIARGDFDWFLLSILILEISLGGAQYFSACTLKPLKPKRAPISLKPQTAGS